MKYAKLSLLLLFLNLIFFSNQTQAQPNSNTKEKEPIDSGLDMLKRYFYSDNQWYVARPSVAKDVKGLIDFIENDPIDTVVGNLNKSFESGQTFVFRLPENVADSLQVQGFYPHTELVKRVNVETRKLQNEFKNKEPGIPSSAITNLDEKLKLVPAGKGIELFKYGVYTMPADLEIPDVIPDSVLNSTEDFNRLVKIDSLREAYVEQKRIAYNDSLVSGYVDSLKADYLQKEFEQELNYQVRRLTDSVKVNNYNLLRAYNETVVSAVNDSIATVLKTLVDYAGFIDSTEISILNYTGRQTAILLKNGNEYFARVWLKNIQNDSLSVLVRSTDKKTISMLIDDGVTFSRYKPKETKEFDFKLLENSITPLSKVGNTYKVETPWIIGGDGHIGFSQTYLANWEKGGQSAVSSLVVLKGFANYKREDGLIKWENSGELRNGMVYQGGDQRELQKYDDKFEITSRYGISAYKKWYYSSEFNLNTQLFRGYKYPKKDNPEPYSAFLAPVRTFFKLGMEYKPNKDFSVLISPLTVKNVFVRDTSLVDQTRFGIDANKKSFWEPGLNADLYFKKTFAENITYETKYKMFVNYKKPFQKQDLNWENIINLKLNEFINIRFLLHLIYDDDVKFAVYDENDVKIGEKSKLQVKEYFSIGFAYKINHKVMNSKRIR
jgi:hypothetical protein